MAKDGSKHLSMDLFEAHTKEEERRFAQIAGDVNDIKNNHLAHIQASISEIETCNATLTERVAWIKWITMTSFGALVTSIINMIFTLLR